MLHPLTYLIVTVVELYSYAVIGWAILELLLHFKIVNMPHPAVYKTRYVLNRLVLPALRPIRKLLPDMGGVDLSPLVLLLLLHFAIRTLVYYF